MITLSNPYLLETLPPRVEFTTFAGIPVHGSRLTPVHIIKEWQWPGDRAKDQSPMWRTVRISEWKMPLRAWFKCDVVLDPDAPNGGWPDPDNRDLILAAGKVRQELVDAGLIAPWYQFPVPDRPSLMMDDATYMDAKCGGAARGEPNDGLPPDYLDFWLEDAGGSHVGG